MNQKWFYMEITWKGHFNKIFTRKCGSLSKEEREKEYNKMLKWLKNNPKLKLINVEFHDGKIN